MTSATPGRATSDVEVTNVSKHGFWLLVDDEELFVSFMDFPWFRDAAIGALTEVRQPSQHHLYWPALDIDLAVESIRSPGQFPLVAQFNQVGVISSTAARRDMEKAITDADDQLDFILEPTTVKSQNSGGLRYRVLVNGAKHVGDTYRTVTWPKIKASLRNAFPAGSVHEVKVVADSYLTNVD